MDEQVKKSAPAIRFKGFEREWQQSEFGLIALRSTQVATEIHLPRVEYEDIASGAGYLNKDVFKKKSKKTGLYFDKGDVLFGKLRPYLKNWWLAEFAGIAVGDFWVLKSSAAKTDFIYFLIQTVKFNEIANQSAGSKMPRSDWKLVSNSLFKIPFLSEEQQKIGGFFNQLDTELNLHQTKLDKLNTLKQAMLQKMFPQDSATEPEIRFKGFSGEWKTNKFGNLVLVQRGGSPRPIEAFITQGNDGVNWVKIGDVSSGSRYINKTKEKIRPEGASSSRWVYKGDLILSNSMSFGRPYIMNIDGCIHDGWLLIRNEKNVFDLEFLLQLLSSEKMLSQYRELASGGVVNNLNSVLVQSTTIVYPKKEEQQKIGAYFRTLDELIALERTQLEKLKQIKQACLAGMFA